MTLNLLKQYQYFKVYRTIKKSGLFDSNYYFLTYPDIRKQDIDPIKHYILYGVSEGRNPNKDFNTKLYLDAYPDVRDIGLNPLLHYIQHGIEEGRSLQVNTVDSVLRYSKRLIERKRDYWDYEKEKNFLEQLNQRINRLINDGSNSKQPLVSIIMPTYNREKSIRSAINSVIEQQYKNYELIVIDDNSTDNTEQVVKDFTRTNNKIKYFKIDKGGVSKARNKGLKEAKGEFIFFLDSDNVWKKHFLRVMVNYMLINNLDAAYSAIAITPDFKTFDKFIGTDFDYASLLESNYIDMNAFGFKKNALNYIFDETLKRLVDWDFILSIVYKRRVDYVPFIGVEYYDGDRGNRITKVESLNKDKISLFDFIQNRHMKKNLEDTTISKTFQFAIVVHVRHISTFIDLLKRIENIKLEYDLYITTPYKIQEIEGLIESYNLKAKIFSFNNAGIDIGPFLYLLPTLQQYSLVLKLNTGQGNDTLLWNKIINSLLYSKESISQIIELFKNDQDLVIAGSHDFYLNDSKGHINLHAAVKAKYHEYMKSSLNNNYGFFVEAMFWYVPSLFKELEYVYKDIEFETIGKYEFTQKHIMERLFGTMVQKKQEYKIALLHQSIDNNLNIEIHGSDIQGDTTPINLKLQSLTKNTQKVQKQFHIGYVLTDYPSLSQTFVHEEIKLLINAGFQVSVYYSIDAEPKALLDYIVNSYKIKDSTHLSILLKNNNVDWCHSHFIYPSVTLYSFEACVNLNLPFSFMPHAVDIFHENNIKRNKLNEISNHPLCKKIIVYSDHHKNYLLKYDVPKEKIAFSVQVFPNSYDKKKFEEKILSLSNKRPLYILSIARFVEKKGLEYIIKAMKEIDPKIAELHLFGFGPLENKYRQIIEKNKINNVFIHGPYKSKEEKDGIYKNADLFALPCIQAKNGDMDGMPTVLFESIYEGVPVLSTKITSIPDFITDMQTGFLVEPNSSKMLVNKILQISNLKRSQLEYIATNAYASLEKRVNPLLTLNTLSSVFLGELKPKLEIFLVIVENINLSYTHMLINEILEKTSTNFKLTLVLNGCSVQTNEKFNKFQVRKNCIDINTIYYDQMVGLGIASNDVLKKSNSEYIIYICANEGYVTKYGWEKPLLDYMDISQNTALGGHLVSSPAWTYGHEYMQQEWFSDFRNKEYADTNKYKEFQHVQGGFYILRKAIYDKIGGFSLPHNHMDVEYSYYIESMGYNLGKIPEIVSLSSKTRPGIEAFLDEHVTAIHPITEPEKQIKLVESINTLNFKYDCFEGKVSVRSIDPFSTIAFRYLTNSTLLYKNYSIFGVLSDESFKNWCKSHPRVFSSSKFLSKKTDSVNKLNETDLHTNDIIMMDDICTRELADSLLTSAKRKVVIWSDFSRNQTEIDKIISMSFNNTSIQIINLNIQSNIIDIYPNKIYLLKLDKESYKC